MKSTCVVVAWFGSQGLYSYTVDGAPLWTVDLGRVSVRPAESAAIAWGPASSPVIWDGLVILQVDTQADSFLLALSVKTAEQGRQLQHPDVDPMSWDSSAGRRA